MKERLTVGVRDALGRLSQVITCADRALQRDIISEHDEDAEPDNAAARSLTVLRQEGVESSRYPLTNGAGKSLFLRVV